MNELHLLGAFVVGGALGTMFVGGLWWSVRKALSSVVPALWFAGSFLLRTAVVLTGVYFISQHSWQRMVVCLCGFVAGRVVAMRLLQSWAIPRTDSRKERHAP